jgi:hypothetical protein
MADEAEELRGGRYVVTRTLGEGAQGDTLEAVDKQAGRLVAVKRFQVRGAKRWKDVELAEREARVLESLSHPSLPAHVEHFEEGGALYLVMENIKGESLAALRRRGATLGRDDVVRFLREASAILDYLHGRAPPVFHRDIKPGNVIRRPDGSFALVDFGAVRDRMKPGGGSTVVGTFGYMAPEQFQGRAQPGSDVYAVGATALAMLTGHEPEELPHQGLRIDVAAALAGRVDPALVEVLAAMLEPDPDLRPAAIRPLLPRLDAGRAPGGERREQQRGAHGERRSLDDVEGEEGRKGRRERRREERHARRAEKRASRHAQRMDDSSPLAGPPLFFAMMGVLFARLAVTIALQVVVPVVLTLLSIFFGRTLRDTARRVRETGTELNRIFDRALKSMRSQASAAAGEPSRVRVAPADAAARAEEAEREEAEREEAEREARAEAEATAAERRRAASRKR